MHKIVGVSHIGNGQKLSWGGVERAGSGAGIGVKRIGRWGWDKSGKNW